MDLLVSDGAQGDHHHVKAVKPAPAFDEMKTHRAGRAEQQQRRGEYLQQAKAMEIQRRLPFAVNSRSSAVDYQNCQDCQNCQD
jgi:hypothetical protein